MLNKIRMWVVRKMRWNTTPYSKEAWERWYKYTSNRDRAIRDEDKCIVTKDNVTELFKT